MPPNIIPVTPADQLTLLEHFRIEAPDSRPQSNSRQHNEVWTRVQDLGAGAFGEVYLERSSRGRVRAIKEVQKLRGVNFKAELLALTRLSKYAYGEYFGQFYGWYEDRTSITFAMEYFDLGDLRQHLNDQVPLPETEVHDIAWQVLQGLNIMHNDRIAHRDLKPENLFVVEAAPKWRIKIGDFGISKRLQNESSILQTRAGTQAYLAPEVLGLLTPQSPSAAYTNAVDVWAVGIIIHELLMLHRPFQGLYDLVTYCQGNSPYPINARFASRISRSAVDFLKCAVAAMPPARWTVSELLSHKWFTVDIAECEDPQVLTTTVQPTRLHRSDTITVRALPPPQLPPPPPPPTLPVTPSTDPGLKVLYNYTKKTNKELTVTKGDVVIGKTTGIGGTFFDNCQFRGWRFVTKRNGSGSGWVPAAYLEEITPNAPPTPRKSVDEYFEHTFNTAVL